MTDWKIAAEDFRAVLSRHAVKCDKCFMDDDKEMLMVSDHCREGSLMLSEVLIADVHAEVQALKKMHGNG